MKLAFLSILALWAAPPMGSAPPREALADLLGMHGFGVPVPDPELDAVADALARRLAGARADDAGAADALRFALESAGIGDAQLWPYTLQHRSGGVETALPALLGRLDRRFPPTHFGAATRGRGAQATTILLVHRGVALDAPLPRTADPGTTLALTGVLRAGYFEPKVLLAPPGHRAVVTVGPTLDPSRRLGATVAFQAGAGVYTISLVAESRFGPVNLLKHRIHVGVRPPALPVTRLSPAARDVAPDRAVLTLVNRARAEAARGPLTWDVALAAVAQARARELHARRVLAHQPGDMPPLPTVLREHGIAFTRFAENLARAPDPDTAVKGFLDSPGHKANVMDASLSRIGVGVHEHVYVLVAIAPGGVPRPGYLQAPSGGSRR